MGAARAHRPGRLGSALALAIGVASVDARADGPNHAAAAQFDYGLAEMMAGRFETGCPAIGASYEAEPLPGTLFTLAECEKRAGKLASALSHYDAFLSFVDRMGPTERAAQSARQAIAVAQRQGARGYGAQAYDQAAPGGAGGDRRAA